jgi:outer membrane receptor protein involved in Fe transport
MCGMAFYSTHAQEIPEKKKDTIKTLDEVSIIKQKKYIKVDSDKTTVAIKDNPMVSTGNSLDAIKKLPGVITSPTGDITLNGKGVSIYFDGAPSSLSGTDLQNYLSSLPANAIEKVELIYNPGASYDANASGSIINIITNAKRKAGVNASFNINYNFNRYQKPSPQVLLNGKTGKLSWQTMTGYNYIDSENRTTTQQNFTAFNPIKKLNQENFGVNTYRNFYFRGGTNYRFNDRSNLLFNYNVNAANERNVFENTSVGENVDYKSIGTTKNKNYNHELSLQYKLKLDTIGTSFDMTAYTNFFDQTPKTISTAKDFNSANAYFNNSDSDFSLKNHYLKYDFVFPFEKWKFSLSTGGKFNVLNVTHNGNYYINTTTPNLITFDYKENNLAFYAEARKKIKKLNITAGLRFENYHVERITNTLTDKVTFTNRNIFPNVSANYEFNEQMNLSASYSKKINQPGYNTLNPNNSSNFDQYNSSQGNPLLNPTFDDNYEIKLSAFQFVQLGANYVVSKDSNLFLFSADANATTPISNATFRQFEQFSTFTTFLNFPIPLDYFLKPKDEFKKRMNNMDQMNYIYVNINYIKSDIKGYTLPYGNKGLMNYAAQSQFILPWGMKNTMTYFILPAGGNWQIYNIRKHIQQFDISFTKDFMNKKLKMGLHCFDVFNQNQVSALIAGENLDTHFREKRDSRTFRISLTYNFGNNKLQKEETTIETEKVKSGGGMMK